MNERPLIVSDPLEGGQDLRRILAERLRAVPIAHHVSDVLGDNHLNPEYSLKDFDLDMRDAAVLVPLIERDASWSVLFTRRTDHLARHAGQISFPGGRIDESDTGPVQAALRETEEEIGIGPGLVDIAGFLDVYQTATGYRIQPVVGLVDPGFDLVVNADEVAEVFEVPLPFFLNPANHELHSIEYSGHMRRFYAMPYEDHYIWGATAGMLKNLYDRLMGERPLTTSTA